MAETLTQAAALTVFATAAIAQSNEEQQLCINDAFRVCSATIPDRARTTACMIQNKSQLSAAPFHYRDAGETRSWRKSIND